MKPEEYLNPKKMLTPEYIFELAYSKIEKEFNDFVGHCMDEDGKPKIPDRKMLMKARGFLSKKCTNTLEK